MTSLTLHQLAGTFPPMLPDEFRQLSDDIKKHGLREPIVLFEGKILDGRHRARACRELGITPKTRTLRNGSPLDFVISMNLKRRHLTESQKAMIGVDIEREYSKLIPKGRPKKSGNNSTLSGKARKHAAKQLGINEHYISDAKAIKKASPTLARAVRKGKKTIPQALKEIRPKKQKRVPDQESGWMRAFHDLFVMCNSVRDIGGVEKLMGGWSKTTKRKIVNQINHIEAIFAEWKSYLEGSP